MAGYTRQDTANDIANNKVIDADDLDEEFDALEAAFDEVSGHTHDGTADEGAAITVIGPNQEIIASVSALYPNADNTLDLGTSGAEFKDLFLDGTANIDSLVADTADINGGTIDGTIIGGTTPAAATVTDLTASGTISFSGATVSDAGSITTADIDGGTIDGTTIGGATPAAGTFTDLTASGTTDIDGGTIDGVTIGTNSAATEVQIDNVNINGNAITTTDTNGNLALTPNGTGEVDISKVDIDSGTIDGVTIGTNSAATEVQIDNININGNAIISTDTNGNIDLTPDGTGEVNISKVDIDDGTIDGVTIGGASAGAVTTTDLTSTGTVDLTSATVNLGASAVDSITEIDSALKSGSDTTLVTGTAGVSGNLAEWDSNGDLVDSGSALSAFVTTTEVATLSNKTIDSANNTLTVDLGEATVTGTTAQFNTALSDDDFVTLGGTETITGNKTFSGTINPSGDVAGDVNPSTDSTYDLGSSLKAWAEAYIDDLYLSGGVYVGGTGSANYLDDYEEGTWTPATGINYSGLSGTFTPDSGRYLKIGNLVFVTGYYTTPTSMTFSTNASYLQVTGLPFTVGAHASPGKCVDSTNWLIDASAMAYNGTTYLYIFRDRQNGAASNFYFTLMYEAA